MGAGRDDPAALRRRRREPALHPRLGPPEQLPPPRRQRPHRRLSLRQCRRLQRLRVTRAPDHQAHRGLQGRQRAALRRQYPGRRHQPGDQDRRRRGPRRVAAGRRLLRVLQGLSGHRAGVRAVRPLRRPQRHRAEWLSRLLGADAAAHLLHLRLSFLRRHHRALRLRIRAERGEPARGADPPGVRRRPEAGRSNQRGHAGGAQLQLHARRLHGADPAHGEPDAGVGHPAQLPGPGPPAVLRGHRRHHLCLEHRAPLDPRRAALRPRATGSPWVSSTRAPGKST